MAFTKSMTFVAAALTLAAMPAHTPRTANTAC